MEHVEWVEVGFRHGVGRSGATWGGMERERLDEREARDGWRLRWRVRC